METLDYLIAKDLMDSNHKVIQSKTKRFKIVQSGVIMQPTTHLSIHYDIVISWLQKSVRLGNYTDAMYCAHQIYALDSHELNISGTQMFRSHMLNRCIIMVSEDIGPAENVINCIFDRYWSIFHKDVDDDMLLQTVAEILHILCNARKSRYIDWAFHAVSEKLDTEDVFLDVLEDCLGDNTLMISTLDFNIPEVMLLYNMYKHRGKTYGMLFIVHALLISFESSEKKDLYDITTNPTLTIPSDILSSIDKDKLEENRSIPNEVIDKHTYWGRKYLDRGMHYFLTVSSKLNNQVIFRTENEIIEDFIKINAPESSEYALRPYQQSIITDSLEYLSTKRWKDHKTLAINMATGTGKTIVSYEIIKRYKGLVLFVFPTLDILDQTLSVWSRIVKTTTLVGVFASNRTHHQKGMFNYEYIDSDSRFDRFMDYDEALVGVKVIFITYSNLSRKLDLIKSHIDLTVYDEGHHITRLTQMDSDIIILTATPIMRIPITIHFTVEYGMKEGIKDGILTRFKICLINDEANALHLIKQHSRKTIVYSVNNRISRELHNTQAGSLYINCKMSGRSKIIRNFNNRKKCLMFNCSIMGEGVDVPSCDSVYFHSGRKSFKTIVQAIGRCLRKYDGKTEAKIFMCRNGDLTARMKVISLLSYSPTIEELDCRVL